MKTSYTAPEMEITIFENEDVLGASLIVPDPDDSETKPF